MLAQINKFLALSLSEKRLLCRAWWQLGWYRAAILTRPFKQLARPLQHHKLPPAAPSVSPQQLCQARRIGYLVAAAARYTPWQSLCLVQVLVVQRELARQHIPGQFYLGVVKGVRVVSADVSTNVDADVDAHVADANANANANANADVDAHADVADADADADAAGSTSNTSAAHAGTDLAAHAWLQCGNEVVNGGAGHERFTIVSTFSWA